MLTALLLYAASVQQPTPLPPAGGWVVDFADNSCLVFRDYRSDTGKVTFGLRLMPNAPFAEATLVVPEDGSATAGTVTVGMNTMADVPWPYKSGPASDGRRLIRFDITPYQAKAMSNAREISFTRGGKRIAIAAQAMAKAMSAASACQDDLLRSWGADPAQEAKISWRPAIVAPERDMSDSDYPTAALREGAEGDTLFRLNLDRTGRIADCRIVASAGNSDLDTRACTLMRERGSLPPARLADGSAAPTVIVGRFAWRLPG
jgi:TonB family protein